jgi:hypothetical protein
MLVNRMDDDDLSARLTEMGSLVLRVLYLDELYFLVPQLDTSANLLFLLEIAIYLRRHPG